MTTHTLKSDAPRLVNAVYAEQIIPRYKGNKLIEALPPSMLDEDVIRSLRRAPDFCTSYRELPSYVRSEMLEELLHFLFPLPKHIEIVRQIESMMRSGYVGRLPRSAEHHAITQSIYEGMQAGKSFTQTANSTTSQISFSLIGTPGIGKSNVFTRYLASLPEVIYHESMHVYQIPYLMFDMPPGSSVKSLCEAIFLEIDRLVPNANYYETFVTRGKRGTDTLLRSVAHVMNIHQVGILICDEVQNLKNATKGGQRLMTEIVSMCNELKVPIFFIGTNKAASILSEDFRQARRFNGKIWEPIRADETCMGQFNIWDMMMSVLWEYQWVKKPVDLSQEFIDAMYHYSQGIIDVAIKLFIAVQKRAMENYSEEITLELLSLAYHKDLRILHRFLDALRSGDTSDLLPYEDLMPVDFTDTEAKRPTRTKIPAIARGLAPHTNPKAAPPAPSASGTSSGNKRQPSHKKVTAPRSTKKADAEPRWKTMSFNDRPNDLRRAYQVADQEGISPLQALIKLGMAPRLEEVFPEILGNATVD